MVAQSGWNNKKLLPPNFSRSAKCFNFDNSGCSNRNKPNLTLEVVLEKLTPASVKHLEC